LKGKKTDGRCLRSSSEGKLHLVVTSLKYLEIEDMIAAIGLLADQLCLNCWQGK